MGYLTKHGIVPAEAPFSRDHEQKDGFLDLEAGIPVREAIRDYDRVKASTLPGGRAASTWHVGPYHELMDTHNRQESWMKEQGLKSGGGIWEVYWTDPGLEPNAEKGRTEILWPIEGLRMATADAHHLDGESR